MRRSGACASITRRARTPPTRPTPLARAGTRSPPSPPAHFPPPERHPVPRSGKAPRPAGPRGLSVASRKPDPVVGDHPSGTHVAVRLMRPKPGSLGRATLERSPIWSCTGRGLPSRPVARTAGELLPHRFTLTRTPRKGPLAVCSLLRFPSGFPGWPLASALLCGVRTFLGREPCGLRRAPRRDPLAATWLAFSVYHRVRKPRRDFRGETPNGLCGADQRRMRMSAATTATAPPTQAAAHA